MPFTPLNVRSDASPLPAVPDRFHIPVSFYEKVTFFGPGVSFSIEDGQINDATINDATLEAPTINDATINDATIDSATIDTPTINTPTINDGTIDGATLTDATITPESWTAISLQNSWVDFGGSYGSARIRKNPDGMVQVEGFIKSGTSTATTLVFQIPAAMRPTTQLMLPLAGQAGLSAAYVTTSGGFRIQYGFTGTWTSITCSWVA